jgi:YVTN family beta-propeller protein
MADEIWVTNEKDDTISVIDTETLEVTRTIATGERPRGITFSNDYSRVYICASDTVQQPTLDMDLTVTRNLSYLAALHGITGREADGRIAAALDRMGVAERANGPVRILNGGHRRRVEIARALRGR